MSSVPRVLQKCTQSFTNDLIFTRKGQLSSVLHFPELKGRPHSQTVMSNHCVAGECLKQTTFFFFFPSLFNTKPRSNCVFREWELHFLSHSQDTRTAIFPSAMNELYKDKFSPH